MKYKKQTKQKQTHRNSEQSSGHQRGRGSRESMKWIKGFYYAVTNGN